MSLSSDTATPNNYGGSNNNGQLEVAWNAAEVCSDLQKASKILSERNLKLSAKWAVEQWMGLPPEVVMTTGTGSSSGGAKGGKGGGFVPSTIPDDLLFHDENNPAVYYAKTLMELGEYAHAAATLSEPSLSKAKVECMPAPLSDLSPFGFYLRAYALFMAGERRKEEDYLELKRYAAASAFFIIVIFYSVRRVY